MFLLAQNNLIDFSLLFMFNILLILFKPVEGYYDFLGGVLILTIIILMSL